MPTGRIDPTSLPFDEAIAYFRQKVSLPTKRWDDLWAGMHARAFVVAGAMKDELLADLRQAVDKAEAEGTTLEEFRKDFDRIVKTHGWAYKGGRGWRTRVIYDTNLRTAYNAGRYKQQTDPDVLRARPYFEYRHGDSKNPRPLHLSWDGLVLPADHPWWKSHYTPNGWGCQCKIFSLSMRDLARLGKSGPDPAPDDGTYSYTDRRTGEVKQVPNGIDPGWDYNVGEAAWGRRLSDATMDAWRAQGAEAWERLTPGDWRTAGRPEQVPLDTPRAELGRRAQSAAEVEAALRGVLGGEEKIYRYRVGEFTYAVNVNASVLAQHVDPDRAVFVPLLPELLEDPYEVWLSFERHRGTGEVVLRQRIIKAVTSDGKEGLLLVAQALKGQLEAWTFVPVARLGYLQKQREGKLVWGR